MASIDVVEDITSASREGQNQPICRQGGLEALNGVTNCQLIHSGGDDVTRSCNFPDQGIGWETDDQHCKGGGGEQKTTPIQATE